MVAMVVSTVATSSTIGASLLKGTDAVRSRIDGCFATLLRSCIQDPQEVFFPRVTVKVLDEDCFKIFVDHFQNLLKFKPRSYQTLAANLPVISTHKNPQFNLVTIKAYRSRRTTDTEAV